MCRPGHGFSRNLLTGGHIGPPLRDMGWCSGTNGDWRRTGPPPPGRDGARPLRGTGGVRGGVRLGCGFRQPNFGTKFGASVMGIGPYAPRGDEGRHAGSSCPTGGCGEPPRLPWGAAHSGASAPAGARDGRESRQRLPQKCPATSDNPSVSLRLTAPFTQGSLWGRGYGLPRRFAPRNDSSDPLSFRGGPTGRRGNPSFFTMDGGSGRRTKDEGNGTPRSSAPTERRESPINHPSQPARNEASAPAAARDGRESTQEPSQKGDRPPATAWAALSEAESTERAAGQIQVLPDD